MDYYQESIFTRPKVSFESKYFNVIFAMNKNGVIGETSGCLPWHCPRDLQYFKETTMNKNCIVGRITAETLPELPGRNIYIATGDNFQDLVESINDTEIWIIGGSKLYDYVFENYLYKIKKIYMTIINETRNIADPVYMCNIPGNWKTINYVEYPECSFYQLNQVDCCFKSLMSLILKNGNVGKSRVGDTIGLFHQTIDFSLRGRMVPIISSKKIAIKTIINELFWFLSGSSDPSVSGTTIWDKNTSREYLDNQGLKGLPAGETGPLYGHQWRNFGGDYTKDGSVRNGIDQIAGVINSIKEDPYSRRHIITAWNPMDLDKVVLPPCHDFIQIHRTDFGLSLSLYMRSGDVFLGIPFNITSYSLFLHIICHFTGYQPDHIYITIGNAHIYLDHVEQCKLQLTKYSYMYPILTIDESIKDIDSLKPEHLKFIKYKTNETVIKAVML